MFLSVIVWLNTWFREVLSIFWQLARVMVPVLLLVRVVELLGWIPVLARGIEPLMIWLGLPGEMGLVWMSGMVSNIYTAMVVFYQVGGEQLTVAQVSVLGTMILIAHALPVEVAIARAAGVSAVFSLLLRIGGALLLGALLHVTYTAMDWLQEPVPVIWQPGHVDNSWLAWFLSQAKILLAALLIIAALTLLIRLMRALGIEKLIHWMMTPFLRFIGLPKKAANITVVGLTLGLSFGGGLLIREARSGQLEPKAIVIVMTFLGLCHSIIEDTLLILLLGADLSAVLWGRLILSLLIVAIISRLLNALPSSMLANLCSIKSVKTHADGGT